MNDVKGQWLKLHQAANMLGVSEVTLRRKIKKGLLPYEFRQGKYYVPLSPALSSLSLQNHESIIKSSEVLEESQDVELLKKIILAQKQEILELKKITSEVEELRRQIADQITLIQILESP